MRLWLQMYKIFVNCHRCIKNHLIFNMKKLIFSFAFLIFLSCGSDSVVNNCFPGITLNETVNLSNPEFINIQVPGGSTITTLQGRRVIIIRRTTSEYKAFDLQCPEGGCSSEMTFDGLKLKCSCDNKEYNSLNGSPIDGNGCFALEYIVRKTSTTTLQISR